jgi:hypothetical protein
MSKNEASHSKREIVSVSLIFLDKATKDLESSSVVTKKRRKAEEEHWYDSKDGIGPASVFLISD